MNWERVKFEDCGDSWLIQYARNGRLIPAFYMYKSSEAWVEGKRHSMLDLFRNTPTEFWSKCQTFAENMGVTADAYPELMYAGAR